MGKGDQRSKRGKIVRGTAGNTRQKKSSTAAATPASGAAKPAAGRK